MSAAAIAPGGETIPRSLAKKAGVWYAAVAVTSMFGMIFVDHRLYVEGNAAATAAAILANERLYRIGMALVLAGRAAQVPLVLNLYRLFKSTSKELARTMLALELVMVPIAFLDMLCKFAPLVLLKGSPLAAVFTPAQLQALSLLSLDLYQDGIVIAGVFWGLWLLPLGLLVWKSGLFPRIFGVLLLIGFASYMVDSLCAFVLPEARQALSPFVVAGMSVAELPFVLWLLIMGAREMAK